MVAGFPPEEVTEGRLFILFTDVDDRREEVGCDQEHDQVHCAWALAHAQSIVNNSLLTGGLSTAASPLLAQLGIDAG